MPPKDRCTYLAFWGGGRWTMFSVYPMDSLEADQPEWRIFGQIASITGTSLREPELPTTPGMGDAKFQVRVWYAKMENGRWGAPRFDHEYLHVAPTAYALVPNTYHRWMPMGSEAIYIQAGVAIPYFVPLPPVPWKAVAIEGFDDDD